MKPQNVAFVCLSMASKMPRFQTLMPYCTATLAMISANKPIDAIQARRSPFEPQ